MEIIIKIQRSQANNLKPKLRPLTRVFRIKASKAIQGPKNDMKWKIMLPRSNFIIIIIINFI